MYAAHFTQLMAANIHNFRRHIPYSQPFLLVYIIPKNEENKMLRYLLSTFDAVPLGDIRSVIFADYFFISVLLFFHRRDKLKSVLHSNWVPFFTCIAHPLFISSKRNSQCLKFACLTVASKKINQFFVKPPW